MCTAQLFADLKQGYLLVDDYFERAWKFNMELQGLPHCAFAGKRISQGQASKKLVCASYCGQRPSTVNRMMPPEQRQLGDMESPEATINDSLVHRSRLHVLLRSSLVNGGISPKAPKAQMARIPLFVGNATMAVATCEQITSFGLFDIGCPTAGRSI